jgi:hypothetical protein
MGRAEAEAETVMRRSNILLASAIFAIAATTASAGSLDFWESSRGARDVTAQFPNGPAQIADVDFDADSAEGGGMLLGATEIEIRPTDNVSFAAFTCQLKGCNSDDYVFTPGTASQGGKLLVSDPDFDEKHGIYDLGTITFDAPQQPGTMPLVNCNYTGLDFKEHTCSPFVLVSLPEPARAAALLASATLLAGLSGRRRTR